MEYIRTHADAGSAYELGADLFGIASSGDGDRSSRYRTVLKEKLRAKHAH